MAGRHPFDRLRDALLPESRAEATKQTLAMERTLLETQTLEEFRAGRLTKPDLRRLLGFETRAEIDGFLKDHGVFDDYDMADLERERDTLGKLGLRAAPRIR